VCACLCGVTMGYVLGSCILPLVWASLPEGRVPNGKELLACCTGVYCSLNNAFGFDRSMPDGLSKASDQRVCNTACPFDADMQQLCSTSALQSTNPTPAVKCTCGHRLTSVLLLTCGRPRHRSRCKMQDCRHACHTLSGMPASLLTDSHNLSADKETYNCA
jgi:hypothetical protein